MNKRFVLIVVLFVAMFSVQSSADERTVFLDVGAALAFGGDKLVEFKVENKDGDRSSLAVYGGTGYMAHAGMLLRFYTLPIDILTTYGYHEGSTDASNASAKFKRNRLDLVPYVRFKENHRIGLGLSFHSKVNFSFDFEDIDESIDYKDAMGIQVAYDYMFLKSRMSVGGRYTDIEYEPTKEFVGDYNYKTIDGSHIAVVFNYAI